MPIYVYKCPVCDYVYHDYQNKYIGSRDILCSRCAVTTDNNVFPKVMFGNKLQRDYQAERASVIPDWEPGYNPGIDYNYTSKADLMAQIKRRGLYPSIHGGGVSVGGSKAGLYGDEEHKNLYNYSQPVDMEGLDNVAPLTKT